MRGRFLAFALLLLSPAQAAAEWQVKPFFGITFGGKTSIEDSEHAADNPNVAFGTSTTLLGEVVGIDVDIGYAPGFFQTGDQELVTGSAVTTLTGNLVIALPRSVTGYSLRPYLVGGAGWMRVRIEYPDQPLASLPITSNLAVVDIGGGATGFVTDRIGVSWDLRYFRSFGGGEHGDSFGPEQLSFWRAYMALAIRY